VSEAPLEQGTLFMLAILGNPDDAAGLRTDLKRSRISHYKLQQCERLNDGLLLLGACGFDLVFISLEEHEDCREALDEIRAGDRADYPVVGLASRRWLEGEGRNLASGLEAVVAKEDLSPSLAEQVVRSAIERRWEREENRALKARLDLALEVGRLGAFVWDRDGGRLELDGLAASLFGLPAAPVSRPLAAVLAEALEPDREAALEAFAEAEREIDLSLRLSSDTMPPPCLRLKAQALSGRRGCFVGVARRLPQTSELFDRISEANAEIDEAFKRRERELREAEEKLRWLASQMEEGGAAARSGPSPEASVSEAAERSASEQAEDAAADSKSDSLAIDEKAAYEGVSKALGGPEPREETEEKQAFFPFDLSANAPSDFSPPDPAREGFAGAARRLVSMVRKAHGLEVSLSIGDEEEIELERERELLFSILKELLTNVTRHARASLCMAAVFRDEDDWVLQVEDDGVGMPDKLRSVAAPLDKIGLFRIRTQLALKGGRLEMAPASPTGLVARARLPVSLSDRPAGRG